MARTLFGVEVDSSGKIVSTAIETNAFPAFDDDRLSAKVTADIILAVDPATGDDDDPTRPFPITGDLSSYKYETIERALADLPKQAGDFTVRVDCAYGTSYDAAVIQGFTGKGYSVQIIGSWSLATLTTGPNSFTAGTGSNNTVLKRRGGVAWTAGNLVNKYVRITSGPGYVGDPLFESVVQIVANDGDTAVLGGLGLYAMDDTSVVQIVNATKITHKSSADALGTTVGLGIFNNSADVFVRRFEVDVAGDGAYYGLYENGNSGQISIGNCKLKGGTHSKAAGAYTYSPGLVLEDADLTIDGVQSVAHYGTSIDGDSTMEVSNFTHATVDMTDAWECTDDALTIKRGVYAEVGFSANDCTSTPLTMYSILNMKIGTYGIEGTNAGTSYGIVIGEGGQYALQGATLSGSDSNEVFVEGKEIDYATLGTYGSVRRFNTVIQWGSGRELLMQKLSLWVEPGNEGDELATNDHQIGGRFKHYGQHTLLGDAGGTQAAAGSNLSGATQLKYVVAIINSGTGGVKLAASGVGAGVGTVITWIFNKTSASINVYPPNSSGVINGGAAGAPIVLTSNSIAQVSSIENIDFVITTMVDGNDLNGFIDSVSAAGSDQAGATALTARNTRVTGGSGGVRLPTGRPYGEKWLVINSVATNPGVGLSNAINVYPGSGETILPNSTNVRDYLSGNQATYYFSLGSGSWRALPWSMKSDHLSQTFGNTAYFYGPLNAFNGFDVTGTMIHNSGNFSNTVASTLTTAGTTITVNFNNSINQCIDLQGASGDVTVTLSSGVSGGWYTVKVIQGSTARQITWAGTGNVKWNGGTPPTISAANDAVDLFTFYHDGSGYLGEVVAQALA